MGVLWTWLSNPAVINLLVAFGLGLYYKLSKAQADADQQAKDQARWSYIVSTAGEIVNDLLSKGWDDWSEVATLAMQLLVKEVGADPSVPSLTPEETGKIAPYLMVFAQRKNGFNAPARVGGPNQSAPAALHVAIPDAPTKK